MKFVTPANKSISCLPIINLGKSKKIEEYFEEAKNIKNLISKTLHEKHLIDIYNSNLKFEKDLYKSIKSKYIGSWELQTITKEIIEHKKEQINRFVFKYSPKIIIENSNPKPNSKSKNNQKYIYKKNTRGQKAISASLKYFYILRSNLNLYKSDKKDKEYKKKLFEIMIKNKKSFDEIKKEFPLDKWMKIQKITKMIISSLDKKLKLGLYTTGSHYKNGQVTKSPLLLIDESNIKYKMFYELKTLKGNIHIPLAYKEKYHQKFKFFLESSSIKGKKRAKQKEKVIKLKKSSCEESLIQRQHMISLSERTNRLLIGLSYQKEQDMLDKNKIIGIDVGSRSNNHLATKFGLTSFSFDDKISEKLKNLDNRHEKDGDNSKLRFDLKKLFREVLDLRLKNIKSFLISLKIKGYTDVVMENIGQFNKTRGKNHDNNLKITRYREQLINLGGLENEFRTIAHNLGMRIHSIPSYYTSKYCYHCNTINDDNRNGEKFVCINCGSSGNADIHAAQNIEYIFERFSKTLCKASSFSELIANKYLTKDRIKEVLTQ